MIALPLVWFVLTVLSISAWRRNDLDRCVVLAGLALPVAMLWATLSWVQLFAG